MEWFKFDPLRGFIFTSGDFLMVQWLQLCLPLLGVGGWGGAWVSPLVGELRFCMPYSLAKKKVYKNLKQYLHVWKLLSKNWNVWPHSGDSGVETLFGAGE